MSKIQDLEKQLYQTAKELYQPLDAVIELTLQCPLRCRHCYNFDRNVPKKNEGGLTRLEVIRLISELADAGTLFLAFTGGEPLLCKDLEEYIRVARQHHFVTRIKTNAVLLTEERIVSLKNAGLNDLDISLYGSTDEVYQKFTDIRSGFTKVSSAVELLIKAGFKPTMNIILHRQSVHQLDEMIRFCEFNALPINVSLEITDRQDGTSTNDYILTREQYIEIMKGPHGQRFLAQNKGGGLQCPCAVTNCGISYSGKVYPCIGAPIEAGNIREKSFGEIWNHSGVFKKIRNIKNEDFKDCFTCTDKHFCQRSSGSAYTNTGDYMGKDPRTCDVSSLRRQVITGVV